LQLTAAGIKASLDLHEKLLGDCDEALLGARAGRNNAELVRRDDANAATLHLLKEASRLDVAHEEDALDGLYVGAGGDHVHSDGDAGIEAVAEVGKDFIRRERRCPDPVGDLGFRAVAVLDDLGARGKAGAVGDLLARGLFAGEFSKVRCDSSSLPYRLCRSDHKLWWLHH
jgi:hypothetical protein